MQLYILISSLVFVLFIGTLIIGAIVARKSRTALASAEQEGKQPKGYWLGIGICTGLGIGTALGTALENIGAGIAIGIAIGVGIGASLEQKNKDNIRPLTEFEKRVRKWGIGIGLIALLLVTLTLAAVLLIKMR